jgi:putative phage-type endonuclease
MKQRSPEWYAARLGKVTASHIADVTVPLKSGAWSKPRGKYMEQKVAERLTGHRKDEPYVRPLEERGNMEPEARIKYSYFADNDVDLVGFVDHPTIEWAGASPDGLIGRDGQLEIKCLDADTHVRLLQGDDSVILEYVPQMMFQMACTGREWCDFVSYSPFMPGALKVFIRRIQRDEDCIKQLEGGVRQFLSEVEAKLAAVLALCQKAAA